MQDWQVSIQIQAMALMVQVEAMKIKNKEREDAGCTIVYDEKEFWNVTDALNNLAREIKEQ